MAKQYFIQSVLHRNDNINDKQDFTFTGGQSALVKYFDLCKAMSGATNAADGVVTMWDEYHNVIRHDEITIPVAPTTPAAQG